MKRRRYTRSARWSWWLLIVDVALKFGISGTTIICGLVIFVFRSSLQQHREFIDMYILLKFPADRAHVQYLVLVFISLLVLAQNLYFRKRARVNNNRIKPLESHLNLVNKKLLTNNDKNT